jgi:hypothetical protein
MDALPLPVIGWLYTIVSSSALLLGAYIVAGLHLQGEGARRQLLGRVVEDAVLFGIWILGLAGGIGVLLEQPWSRPLLEFFCWVLTALTLFSAYSRLRAPGAARRGTLALSIALFVLPILAVCGATITTLRGEEAIRVLGAQGR